MSDAPDPRRLEELSLNSSAPPGQLLYDGWLLRLAPGKAKRARSVNAVYASRLPIEAKIAHCERLYARSRLPALFRITPFSEPRELDAALAERGYARFDDTAVESASIDPARLAAGDAEPMDLEPWAERVAALRGSPRVHLDGHVSRLRGMPLAMMPMALRSGGEVVATGLAMIEDDSVGIFDIVTHPEHRTRGHARVIVSALLRAAHAAGARHAYLQVQADNEPARRLYRSLGFQERYRYWYRGREGEAS